MKEAYIIKRFGAERMAMIQIADEICDDYAEQGLSLTLRQLYYQFVSRDILPNSLQSYNRLKGTISDARLAGLIDWDAIVDRGRNLRTHSTWDDPASVVEACAEQFTMDHWAGQDWRVEVWIEKEALIGVLQEPCDDLQTPYFACKGYNSQSEQWRAGKRFAERFDAGQRTLLLHLGDHDPSGIDMTRDNTDRLEMFCPGAFQLERIALNMDQIDQYNPPPNPAKFTDSRAEKYVEEFGTSSWELDALEPAVMQALVREKVEEWIDWDMWNDVLEEEKAGREQLTKLAALM